MIQCLIVMSRARIRPGSPPPALTPPDAGSARVEGPAAARSKGRLLWEAAFLVSRVVRWPRQRELDGRRHCAGRSIPSYRRKGGRAVLGDLEASRTLADELGGIAQALDVTDRASVEAFVAAADPVDCAAICPPDPWDTEDFDAVFDRVMAINARGPKMLTRAFMPALARGDSGRIVLIGSIASRIGGVHSLARRGRGDGTLVNAVVPAPVDTDMIRP